MNSNCKQCPLHKSRTNIVWGEGPDNADLLLCGEAPGYHEDISGHPFCGKAGDLLTKLLNGIGINRGEVYITNIVKCRPPDNRDPTDAEIEACRPYLQKQLDTIQPRVIATLGRISTRWFLGDVKMQIIHGIPHKWHDKVVAPCYHPAAGMHNPANKLYVDRDFQALKRIMDGKLKPVKHEVIRPLYSEIKPSVNWSSKSAMAVHIDGQKLYFCHNAGIVPSFDIYNEEAKGTIENAVTYDGLHTVSKLNIAGFPPYKVRDISYMVHVLGDEPKKLEDLALRWCGMTVNSPYEMVDAVYRINAKLWTRIVHYKLQQRFINSTYILPLVAGMIDDYSKLDELSDKFGSMARTKENMVASLLDRNDVFSIWEDSEADNRQMMQHTIKTYLEGIT